MAIEAVARIPKPNTKEDASQLYIDIQGSLIFEELITSHLVKMSKMYDGFA